LLDYLRAKNMLLILDNFEHLMEGVDLPLEIIRDAPGVKVLVISRSRLNVLEETALRVPGMDLPEPNSHAPKTLPLEEMSRFSAMRFFVQCARRAQPGFKLS